MLFYLSHYEDFFGPLRLFKYNTFRIGGAVLTALMIGFFIAPRIMAALRALKMAQSFRDQAVVGALADLHASKKHTPTMGGLVIYMATTLSLLLWSCWNIYVGAVLWVYTGLTILGFIDDYLKVSRRNSRGVPGRWKMVVQAMITLSFMALLLFNSQTQSSIKELWIPFVKDPLIDALPIGILFIFFFLVIAGSSNAINLTDGVDGLAAGCTLTVTLVYGLFAYCTGHKEIADYLFLSYLPGVGELSVVCAALIGALLVFLWYNAHPAEMFMGDTGSLALGGLVGTVALLVHQPITLIIVGGIFVIEAMSVILQVGSYRLRGKRIFRMAPIHHHFELKGWPETKVVIRFWILSIIFALIGLSTLKLR